MLFEKIPVEKLQDAEDTENVEYIHGLCCSEQGILLFADGSNQSVKQLQLQTRTVKTLYKSDWWVLNVLQQSDLHTLLVCERIYEYVVCLSCASILSLLVNDFNIFK